MNSTKEFAVGQNDISWIGSNFKEHLYGIAFKKASAEGLETQKLSRFMNDTAILKEFDPAPVLLGDVLAFLKTANHSDWYIFYVNDAKGTLWAVDADWDGSGWRVGANPVSDPREWYGGRVLVSRSFSETSEKDALTLSPSETESLGLPTNFTERLEALEAIVKYHNLTCPTVS